MGTAPSGIARERSWPRIPSAIGNDDPVLASLIWGRRVALSRYRQVRRQLGNNCRVSVRLVRDMLQLMWETTPTFAFKPGKEPQNLVGPVAAWAALWLADVDQTLGVLSRLDSQHERELTPALLSEPIEEVCDYAGPAFVVGINLCQHLVDDMRRALSDVGDDSVHFLEQLVPKKISEFTRAFWAAPRFEPTQLVENGQWARLAAQLWRLESRLADSAPTGRRGDGFPMPPKPIKVVIVVKAAQQLNTRSDSLLRQLRSRKCTIHGSRGRFAVGVDELLMVRGETRGLREWAEENSFEVFPR